VRDTVHNQTYMYQLRDHEAGNLIAESTTLQEAEAQLDKYVSEDISNNVYTPNFYEIYNTETDNIEMTA